jgi:adenylyltransferase/sulfurtransferase
MSGELARELVLDVYREARKAFPNECCGWMTATAVRPCVNNYDPATTRVGPAGRTAEAAYEITGKDLLALAKSLRSPDPALVIYHSHPNGRAYFSAADRAAATFEGEPTFPVRHLVVGIDPSRVVEAALFAWNGTEWVETERLDGADL